MRPRGIIWSSLSGLLLGAVLLLTGQVAAEPTHLQPAACVELIQNGGFESGSGIGWQEFSLQEYELISRYNPRAGEWGAFLGGVNDADDRLSQTVALPAGANLALTGWWSVATDEQPYQRYDTLTISLLRPSDGSTLATLVVLDNTAEENVWEELTFDLAPYAGQSVTISMAARTDDGNISDFYLDDISLLACASEDTPTPTATSTVATLTPMPTATRDPMLRNLYLPLILK